ncbi:hypothetical protein PF003_g1279 [Phytophthora fragariae]|nr:hypothetical protein PF003_g1279 [Phytophthora fragariae]
MEAQHTGSIFVAFATPERLTEPTDDELVVVRRLWTLLVEAQHTASIFVAFATPERLTEPTDDELVVVRRLCGAAGGSPAHGLDTRHAGETH